MLPSFTLHSAVKVAVIATLIATIVLMREPPPGPPDRSTASETVSAMSLMAVQMLRPLRRKVGADAVVLAIGRGTAHANPPRRIRVRTARSAHRRRAAGTLPHPVQ